LLILSSTAHLAIFISHKAIMSILSFIIRDAIESDVATCLALDHSYETEHVWQMNIFQDEHASWQVAFRAERLPRKITVDQAANERRLRLALHDETCFLVAVGKADAQMMLGYLTMSYDPIHQNALIQDLIVSQEFRHSDVTTRLFGVARRWAVEQDAYRLLIEVQTKNFPIIQFCQSRGLRFCGFNDQYFPNQDIAVFFGQALR